MAERKGVGVSRFCCFTPKKMLSGADKKLDWLVVSTHLKNISQIGNLPQVGMKMKNIWNHHLAWGWLKVVITIRLTNLMNQRKRKSQGFPCHYNPLLLEQMPSSLQSSVCTFAILVEHPKLDPPRTPPKKIVRIHPWRLTAGTCPHGGLVQIIFLSKWVICRFQPFIFQGIYRNCQSLRVLPVSFRRDLPNQTAQPCKTWHTHLTHPMCDRSGTSRKDTGQYTHRNWELKLVFLRHSRKCIIKIYINDFRGRRIGDFFQEKLDLHMTIASETYCVRNVLFSLWNIDGFEKPSDPFPSLTCTRVDQLLIIIWEWSSHVQ